MLAVLVVLAFMNHDSKNMVDGSDRVRGQSKLLFGNVDRVEVAAVVARAERGGIYSRALAVELGWPDNRVQKQLKQFAEAGLLTALPQLGGERRVYYERADSSFWGACEQLLSEWSATRRSADS
jgi:hypothetical protein